jgi:hypothetical protein
VTICHTELRKDRVCIIFLVKKDSLEGLFKSDSKISFHRAKVHHLERGVKKVLDPGNEGFTAPSYEQIIHVYHEDKYLTLLMHVIHVWVGFIFYHSLGS